MSYYKCVTNKKLKVEIIISLHDNKTMTAGLRKLLIQMVKNIANRGEWSRYRYQLEMKNLAMINLCRAWKKYDADTFNPDTVNPWAYFLDVIKASFYQHIKNYKRMGWMKPMDREALLNRPIIMRKKT